MDIGKMHWPDGACPAPTKSLMLRGQWLTGASRRASFAAPGPRCASAYSCLTNAKAILDAGPGN